jgi:hypothetical protein
MHAPQGNQQLSDAALGHCAKLGALQHLETSNCWKLTDDGLCKLAALTALAHLDLSYCWQVRACADLMDLVRGIIRR